MGISNIWKGRLVLVGIALVDLLWVFVIYLTSELVIWGLSMGLAPVKLQFFASILGMLLVFISMTAVCFLYRESDGAYMSYVKSKVDFVNAHLGVGFPIPIVMLDENNLLNGHDVACVIGNFIVTNIVSWTAVFALSLSAMAAAMAFKTGAWKRAQHGLPRPFTATPPRIEISWHSDSASTTLEDSFAHGVNDNPKRLSEPEQTSMTSQRTSMNSSLTLRETPESPWWRYFSSLCPIVMSFSCAFLVGAPVAAATGDNRVLDGCVLWFVWISSVRLQRAFKHSSILPYAPRFKNILATLLNPVLATTLLMTSYTRVKAAALPGIDFGEVLRNFSSGTPLYALWTASTSGTTLTNNPTGYFGAGDAALSILECGILIWGFKLYECRRQLFSVAGLLTAVISVAAAAGNVFLSVLVGRTMGLDRPEALAFAARCTTLALAKPAMEAAGGNPAVNAALVVSNGILGQLVYPFVLDKLGVETESGQTTPASSGEERLEMLQLGQQRRTSSKEAVAQPDLDDGPMTIAAGITIGINGAAMGVAYLYETKSRAAPYAALAMTVFGVMTVVFTTVEPFKGAVIGLAGG